MARLSPNPSVNDSMLVAQVKEKLEQRQAEGVYFAVVGTTGVGKTSTIKVLFNVQEDLLTDPIEPSTIEIREVSANVEGLDVQKNSLKVTNTKLRSQADLKSIPVITFDFPGVGEGRKAKSEEYFRLYEQVLPLMDAVLWIVRGDTKNYETDISYLSRLIDANPSVKPRLVIGVNGIDRIVSPKGRFLWNEKLNIPISDLYPLLERLQARIVKLAREECGLSETNVVLYSATRVWMLEVLFASLVDACPLEQQWIFANLQQDYQRAFLDNIEEPFQKAMQELYRIELEKQIASQNSKRK
jgi:predicted GTPase